MHDSVRMGLMSAARSGSSLFRLRLVFFHVLYLGSSLCATKVDYPVNASSRSGYLSSVLFPVQIEKSQAVRDPKQLSGSARWQMSGTERMGNVTSGN
jgi:hypothetical protein